MTSGSNRLKLTLSKDGVVAPILVALKDSTEVISICLEAIEKAELPRHARVGEFQTFEMTDSGDAAPVSDRKRHHANWLLSKAFQELAKAVRLSLQEAYLYLAIAALPRHGQTTWGDFQKDLENWKRFARTRNFPDLLEAVNRKLATPLQFAEQFRSLQDVRNCLEHRNGAVSEQDVNTDRHTLRLVLPRLGLFIERDGAEIPVTAEAHVEAGESISIRRTDEATEYPLGTRIGFSSEEFAHIAMGCYIFAADLAQKLPTLDPVPD